MYGSPVEAAVGIAAATAKVWALLHPPQDDARPTQFLRPRWAIPPLFDLDRLWRSGLGVLCWVGPRWGEVGGLGAREKHFRLCDSLELGFDCLGPYAGADLPVDLLAQRTGDARTQEVMAENARLKEQVKHLSSAVRQLQRIRDIWHEAVEADHRIGGGCAGAGSGQGAVGEGQGKPRP